MFTLATGETFRGVAGSASAITYTLTGDEKGVTDAFKVLAQGQLPAATGTLYTVPASTVTLVQKVFLRNVTGGAVTVALYINGTAGTNQILGLQIEANGSAILSGDGLKTYDSTGKLLYVGSTGAQGIQGIQGEKGWSPILAVVTDGARRVFQITSWVGGAGTPPSSTNQFLGPVGIVGTAAAAVDVRGAPGADGVSPNSFVTVTGNSGTATADSPTDSLAIAGSGAVTTVASDGPEAVTISLVADGVTNAMLDNMPANTMKVNATNASDNPTNLAIGASQFPGRSSTGDIAAKAITDAGYTWLNHASVAAMTAALDVATTTTKGLLSFADKKIIDSLHYDFVADFGGVGNDSTLNDSAFSTALSTMPVGAVLFFPAGTYRVSAAVDINVDKRITFRGVNRYTSIIKTTSATAHIFTKSVAGWYDSWMDLGFQSSVTRTAGAAINIPAGNNVGMNVYKCWFTGMFHGINATGAQSANLSVWSDLDISGVTNGGRGIVINGSTINVMIHNVTINAGAATTSACVEINQSGAVQVTGCDWILGTNTLLINSTAGAGPQACYFTNCFFDQPAGSVIKIIGTNTANRIKFTQCGIAPTGNNYGIEVAGTGAGAVGTATALPAGIAIMDCDIYSQNGTNTSAGVFVNGCQDFNIQNSRITGFGGAGGCAVRVTPSASNQTRFRINGNIFGPNSNLTVINTIGVQIDAGASAPAVIAISDNTMTGCTTAIVDNSTPLNTAQDNVSNNQGAQAGFFALATPGATVLTTVETVVMVLPIPDNSLKVGTTFNVSYSGIPGATSVSTMRARIGTSATVPATNTAVLAVAGPATATTAILGEMSIAITVVGGSAAFTGTGAIQNAAATGGTLTGPTGTFDSAVTNFLMITIQSGTTNTHTVRAGSVQALGLS